MDPRPLTRNLRQRATLVAAVLVFSVGCDRVTKELAEDELPDAGRISMMRDTVRVEYVENPGAFLGLGGNLPAPLRRVLLTGGPALMVLAVLGVALLGRVRSPEILGLTLVASGGLGNLWDRVVREGRVVDFLNLGIGPVRTGVFNVADIAIVAGALVLLWTSGHKTPAAVPSARHD
jgi:signal peptidase II